MMKYEQEKDMKELMGETDELLADSVEISKEGSAVKVSNLAWRRHVKWVCVAAGGLAIVLCIKYMVHKSFADDSFSQEIINETISRSFTKDPDLSNRKDDWTFDESSAAMSHVKMIFPSSAKKPAMQQVLPMRHRQEATSMTFMPVITLDENEFKGIEFIRKGYNLLKGNPMGRSQDDGFKADILDVDLTGDDSGETPGLTITPVVDCHELETYDQLKSTEEFEEALKKSVDFTDLAVTGATAALGAVGGGTTQVMAAGVTALAKAAFQGNPEVKQTRTSIEEGKLELTVHSGECLTYRVEVNQVFQPDLTQEFMDGLDKAMAESEEQRSFIMSSLFETYGTHYAVKMTMGHKWTSMKRKSKNTQELEEDKMDTTGSFRKGQTHTTHRNYIMGCMENIQSYTDFVQNCGKNTNYDPVPIRYTLAPVSLHPKLSKQQSKAIDTDYTKYCIQEFQDGCPPYDCVKALDGWCPTEKCQIQIVDHLLYVLAFENLQREFAHFSKSCLGKGAAKDFLNDYPGATKREFFQYGLECVAIDMNLHAVTMAHAHFKDTCSSLSSSDIAETAMPALRSRRTLITVILAAILQGGSYFCRLATFVVLMQLLLSTRWFDQ